VSEPPVIEPDEVLPPESGQRHRSGADRLPDTRGLISSLVARWLDDLLVIPGTRIRLGLDPLISLIPGLGDAAVTGAGAAILFAAVRYRAPVGVLTRMVGNMLLNALINVIPLLGPALSVWFKSNARNNDLLHRHLAGQPPGPASTQSRVVFAIIITIVVGIIALNLALWWFVLAAMASLISGR
jgi:hypothetical protein